MEPSLLQGYNPTICLGLGWHRWFCSQFNPIEEERGWYSSQPSPWIQGYNPTICLSDICDFAFHPIWSQFNPFKESKRGDNTRWVLIIAGLSMNPGVECHHFDPLHILTYLISSHIHISTHIHITQLSGTHLSSYLVPSKVWRVQFCWQQLYPSQSAQRVSWLDNRTVTQSSGGSMPKSPI